MTAEEIRSAIEYNKRRGYCPGDVKLVQSVVGSKEDGVWGPDTVARLAAWQEFKGLDADGKVGPLTWREIEEASEERAPKPDSVEIGCGLAAYDQVWPGHTPEEAMQKAWDRAIQEACLELRFWSTEWLIDEALPNGGRKGNRYSGPWLIRQRPASGLIVGAWVDDPIHNAKSEGFVDRLEAMRITRAALMINKSNTRKSDIPWLMRWSREDLEAVSALYMSRGIECVGTCWPRPSRTQIDAMCEDMRWVLDVLGSKTFEVDTEGNWKSRFLDGFATMEEAAEYLASSMRKVVGDDGELELTTYTYHRENSAKAQLAKLMDRLLPQAYSVRHRGNATVDWNDALGPGHHQKLALQRARQAAAA